MFMFMQDSARFVLLDLPNIIHVIISSLDNNPKAQYLLFKGIFAVRDTIDSQPVLMFVRIFVVLFVFYRDTQACIQLVYISYYLSHVLTHQHRLN